MLHPQRRLLKNPSSEIFEETTRRALLSILNPLGVPPRRGVGARLHLLGRKLPVGIPAKRLTRTSPVLDAKGKARVQPSAPSGA